MCMSMCTVCVPDAERQQKMVSGPSEQLLQAAMSVLGTDLKSSEEQPWLAAEPHFQPHAS